MRFKVQQVHTNVGLNITMKIKMIFVDVDIRPCVMTSVLMLLLLACYVQYVHYKRKIITDNYLHKIPDPTTIEEAHEIAKKFMFRECYYHSDDALSRNICDITIRMNLLFWLGS